MQRCWWTDVLSHVFPRTCLNIYRKGSRKKGDGSHEGGEGGELEHLSCKELVKSEKDHAKHLRLFLSALRHFNDDLTSVRCVRAYEQAVEGVLIDIEIEGKNANDATVKRICKVGCLVVLLF